MTEAERRLCDWQHGKAGSFITAVFTVISKADMHNLDRMSKGFPDEVAAYANLRYSGWGDNLEAEYKGGEK